jgi:putative addiction module component (TIGR02574 family)
MLTPQLRAPTLLAMASLPKNISSLSDVEKFDLLDVLWMDLEAHATDITPEQPEELDRRVAAYEKNPSAVVS